MFTHHHALAAEDFAYHLRSEAPTSPAADRPVMEEVARDLEAAVYDEDAAAVMRHLERGARVLPGLSLRYQARALRDQLQPERAHT